MYTRILLNDTIGHFNTVIYFNWILINGFQIYAITFQILKDTFGSSKSRRKNWKKNHV